MCPCCGYALRIGATVRLKATRVIGQAALRSEPEEIWNDALARYEMKEEAERHG